MRQNKYLVSILTMCALLSSYGCTQKPSDKVEQTVSKSDAERATSHGPTATTVSNDTNDTNVSEPVDEPKVTLQVGDPAPTLMIGHWVKGAEFANFEPNHVYVVEFWATWCAPCKDSMPHLSRLQEKHSDQVTFVGISDESLDTVEKFLASQGPKEKTWDEVANYTIAVDEENRPTNNAYMKASGQGGIPTAFIVGRQGEIEWIGHPMEIDEPLEQIVEGRWDRNEYLTQLEKRRERQVVLRKAMGLISQKKHQEALEIFKQLAEDDWDNSQFLNSVAWMAATEFPRDATDLGWAQKAALRASELTDNKNSSILDTVARIYFEQGNLDAAIEWQQKAVDVDEEEDLAETLESYLHKRDGKPLDDQVEADSDEASVEEE